MKTQNTPENKARFIALHWGQKVLTDGVETHNISSVFNLKHESFFLTLKLLSAISDEDAIEVAILCGSDFKIEGGLYSVSVTIESVKQAFIEALQIGTMNLPLHAIDLLRSKGYLIGWMDLTPEDILAYGWARLEGEG